MTTTNDISNSQSEIRNPKSGADRRCNNITDQDIITWHLEEYQAGDSLTEVAHRHGIGRVYLSNRFKRLGLPVAHKVEFRRYTLPDSDVIPSDARNP